MARTTAILCQAASSLCNTCVHASNPCAHASIVDAVALPLAGLMRHLVTRTSPDFFKEVERLELSFSQVKALNLLTDSGPLSVKGLSDALGLSVAGMSRAVDGLVQRGMVKRTEDPDGPPRPLPDAHRKGSANDGGPGGAAARRHPRFRGGPRPRRLAMPFCPA